MGHWNKKERFEALLSGEMADRPIVSAWRHFIDKEQNAQDLAEATIQFTNQFDWDWVKINPRATYYAEVWGNDYDFHDYHTVFPKQLSLAIPTLESIWEINEKSTIKSLPLKEQLEAVKLIRKGLPNTPLVQTIFSPLTILLFLLGQSSYAGDTVYGSNSPLTFKQLYIEQRAGIHHALHAIALTLANYILELKKVGVDGVFYAITGTANPQLFDEACFNEFSRPYDSIVLEAAQSTKRILHTCGPYANPEWFNDYLIEGISWDTMAHGNPALEEATVKATKVGGVDHKLFALNDKDKIKSQVLEALKLMKDNPFLLAPNCSIPINVTDEALGILKCMLKK